MSRAERVCRALPEWMLHSILRSPIFMRGWWGAAWLELWRRSVEEVAEEGAHVVQPPEGMH